MRHHSFVRVQNVHKTFRRLDGREKKTFKALNGVSFDIQQGESVALLGASGSGKSTLIRMLCALDTCDPADGGIWINGDPIQLDGKIQPHVQRQRRKIGIIFQQFNLVSQLDVMTNVLIGCLPDKSPLDVVLRRFNEQDRVRALECLDKVGLAHQAYQRASTLSGGQQQRVAVARALLKGADLLLADEPVASLDPESSKRVMDVLFGLTRDLGMTLVVSLHQLAIAQQYCSRAIGLSSGEVVFDGSTEKLDPHRLHHLYSSTSGHHITEFDTQQDLDQVNPDLGKLGLKKLEIALPLN